MSIDLPFPLVLASQSPRRQQLLREAGYRFEVVPPSTSAETGEMPNETVPDLVARMARQKAEDVASRIRHPAIIVACDTVAELDGEAIGKPHHRRHAQQILRRLSGREHRVYSGLHLIRTTDHRRAQRVERSDLRMKRLSEEDIDAYLDSGQWEGKAGAFGYQDGHPWLELISGTADNVVGLPLQSLHQLLAELTTT
ncbi:MAG: Maf-like protein [Pirellulaceae bacterium]|nr:MAG: Maf-like protein [Pirellulaceae bacterium]